MIYKNTRHTTLEILQELGDSVFKIGEKTYEIEEVVGKVRVRVGGLRPSSNDTLIKIADVEELELMIGNVTYKVRVEDNDLDSAVVTDHARKVIEARGKKANENVEMLQQMKGAMNDILSGRDPKGTVSDSVLVEALAQVEFIKVREKAERAEKRK